MKKMFKFPSIVQYSNIVKQVRDRAKYVGKDDQGNHIFDQSKVAPTLTFHGTIKLHGTNASVCYNDIDGIWVQSRERIITVESDNAGFASFVEVNKDHFIQIMNEIKAENPSINTANQTICLYGEWCGGSIQKGVALNQLQKMFVVFGVKIMSPSKDENTEDEGFVGTWIDHSKYKNESVRVYNIEDFPTYSIEIDFENPKLAQNKIVEMTIAVEEECPFGKHFGVSGIGEGIVFSYVSDSGEMLRFKSKGEKHSASKVKTVKVVDDAREQALLDLAEKITPNWRVDQAIQEVFDTNNGGTPDVKRIGEVIKWVNQDIMKEELLTISDAGFEPKEVMSKVSQFTKKQFFVVLNESVV